MGKAKIEIRGDIPVVVCENGGCRPCGHAEYEIIKELKNLTICSGCGHLSWDEIKPPHKACCPDSGCSSDIPVRDFIFNIWEEVCKLKCEKAELIEALKWFCMRVEKGEVKSKLTYARFQELLHKHTEDVKGWLSIPI